MQDVRFYPFLGPRACCTKPGCNRRDEISEIYWNCCLYGSGHKILKTTLHEWLLIAEKDRKNSSAMPFHQPSQTWAPTCQIRHWPPKDAVSLAGRYQLLNAKFWWQPHWHPLFSYLVPVKSDSTRFQLTKKCCLYCSLQTTNSKFFQFQTPLPEPPHLTGASCHHFAFVGLLALGQQQPCLQERYPTVPGFGNGIGSMVQP